MTNNLGVLDILMICLRKIWIIVLVAVIAGGAAFGYLRFTNVPAYSTDTTFIVNRQTGQSGSTDTSGKVDAQDLTVSTRLIKTYTLILTSRTFLQDVADASQLGYTASQIGRMISIASVNETEVMRVTVTNKSPTHAAQIANLIADLAPDAITELAEAGSVKVIDNALVPSAPNPNNIMKYTLLAAVLAVVATIAVLVILAIMDDTIRSEEDLRKAFDIPIIGAIPKMAEDKK